MNVVLLVADSLRADGLGCYGNPRPASPRVDALAAAGVRVTDFFTPATPTEPACTSLLTGQFPLTHGILAPSRRCRLARGAPWLPSILAERGYATAAVDDLAWRQHWGRGFGARLYRRATDQEYVDGFALNRLVRPWLDAQRGRRFFLYVRYGDTHTPYWPPAPYRRLFYDGDPTVANPGSLDAFYARPLKSYLLTQWLGPAARQWPGAAGARIEDLAWCRAQYDAEVRTLDDAVGELLDDLDARGALRDTLVVLVGDHGESIGEHGIFFEHHGLYDVTLRPPLVLHAPGRLIPGRTLDAAGAGMVMTPDLAPTILDLLDIPVPAAMEGRSLARALDGGTHPAPRRRVFASEATWMCKWAYRTGTHKLITACEPDLYGGPALELYDLRVDPAERDNLAPRQPALADALRAELDGWRAARLTALGRRGDPVAAHGSMHRRFLRRLPLRKRVKRAVRRWWHGEGAVPSPDGPEPVTAPPVIAP